MDDDNQSLPQIILQNDQNYRMLPHNEEAEQALLGALLVNERSVERISDILKPEHFFIPVHGRIFDAIIRQTEKGQAANPITLKGFFEKDKDLVTLGGSGYLGILAASVVTVVNITDYAHTIYDHYLRRKLIGYGEEVVNEAYVHDMDTPATHQLETAEQRLFEFAVTGETRSGPVPFVKGLTAAIQTAELAFKRDRPITGVTTGLMDLDKMLGGLHKSDLIVLAGRPAMGKTALATNIAVNAAKAHLKTGGNEGAGVVIFSLEMSTEQLATRVLADEARVQGDKIRRGDLHESDFPKFIEASHFLSRIPLYIDDTPGITVGNLRSRARRLKRQHGLGLIVIDYLQLMRGGSAKSAENRVQEISEITRGLKGVAKDLEVPVLALSQLSRAVEAREDKHPQLADLRESGSIEQDADVVMFVYREEYYHKNQKPIPKSDEQSSKFNERLERWENRQTEIQNIAECIIAKQRHGPTGDVQLHFDGEFTKFSDLKK